MKKSLPLLLTLVGWLGFVVTHFVSVYYSLYWYIWWFDIFMHSLGGFLIVLSWYQVKKVGTFKQTMSRLRYQPLLILWGIMLIWELFELKFGLIAESGYAMDTLADFCNGFLGGLTAFWLNQSRTIKQ